MDGPNLLTVTTLEVRVSNLIMAKEYNGAHVETVVSGIGHGHQANREAKQDLSYDAKDRVHCIGIDGIKTQHFCHNINIIP